MNTSKRGDGLPIGLAHNPEGTFFQCPSCNYYDTRGHCTHRDPRLNGYPVTGLMCCNRYESPSMEIIIK